MALSIIGSPVAVNATSVTLPTHAPGDMIILFAFRAGNTTIPAKPSAGGTVPSWTDINTNGGANSCASRSAYFIATASNHTSGTWTNATSMVAITVRGQAGSPIGGFTESGGSAVNQCVAPAITLSKTTGSSMILHFLGQGTFVGMDNTWSAPPAGYTLRASAGASFGTTSAALVTKDVTTSDGSLTQSHNTSFGNVGYRGNTIEILASEAGSFNYFFKGYGYALPTTVYTDDFNRASLGSDWTNRLTPTTGINVEIENSNALGVSGAFNYAFATYYQDMPTDNPKVTITVGPDAVSGDYYLIGLRGDGTEIVYAYCQPSAAPQIMTHAAAGGDWRNMIDGGQTVRAQGPASQSYVAGDTISFEARGNVYTVKKNDVTIVKWNDSGGVLWGANVDSSHRQWGIGIGTVGSATRGLINSVTALSVGIPPTPPYTDSFTADYSNIFLDDNWQNWSSTPVLTTSGRAGVTSLGVWTVASYNWPMLTDHHKISATYVNPNVNFAATLYVRGNNSHQIFGYIIDTGNATALFANTNTWAAVGGTNYGQAVVDWAGGDVASLEAIENAYIIRKNGIAQVVVFDLNGGVWGANVDAEHRDVGIGFLNNSNTATGWDSISAEDLAADYFIPSQMAKSGVQFWADSATWVDITTWTAVNDITHTSLLNGSALTVLTGKTNASLNASVPFSASTAGRQHTIRIVRNRTSTGGVDSTVIATGSAVTGVSGTCTASGTTNVLQGESYIIQMNSDGASAGSVNAFTPTLTIS